MKWATALLTAVAMLVVVFFAGFKADAEARPGRAPAAVDAAIEKHAGRILDLSRRGRYREAIAAAAQYEGDLLACYPRPTYEMGLLQSAAEHVAFHVPFTEWKPSDASEEEMFRKLRMAGFNILLMLQGARKEEALFVFCVDAGRLESRLGGAGAGLNLDSDRTLLLMGQMVAAGMGRIEGHRFRDLGDHRVLVLEVDPLLQAPPARIVVLPADGRLFLYVLVSPLGDLEANEKRLFEMVKTTSFDYRPADRAAIRTVRTSIDKEDVALALKGVERLARMGEFNAAADDLNALRLQLFARMPKAAICNGVAYCDAYGVSLKNPDPTRWKLSVEDQGPTKVLVLEDRQSVRGEGIGVAVFDLVMVYGPDLAAMLADADSAREFLIDGGRGGAAFLGAVQQERLTTVQGKLAYEAVVEPNIPGVKARIQFQMRMGYGVMVFVLAGEDGFDARLAECDRILSDQRCLSLRPTDETAAPEEPGGLSGMAP